MAAQSGFQSNTTIHAAFWRYIPDPRTTPPPGDTYVEVNSLQYFTADQDHTKVWLYYAQNTNASTQSPVILEGDVAKAFMADMEALF